MLRHIPDLFKVQEVCIKAVEEDPRMLGYVPDWSVMQSEQLKMCYNYHHELIKWYENHEKRKAQIAKIKDKLMPIAWHPSRW